MKPPEYRSPHVVMQDVTYSLLDNNISESLARTGMLSVGRVVWLAMTKGSNPPSNDAQVQAWAEGIGAISVSRTSIALTK